MVAIPTSFALAIALLLVMGALTVGLGVYLVSTNPPKDETSFIGIGQEKLSDDELN